MATIERSSENSYRITVSCGYDSDGKQIRKRKTISLSQSLTERQRKKEIQKEAVLFEKEVQNGTYLDSDKITFGEFSQIWLTDYAKQALAPKTLQRYETLLIRINQALGNLKLCKIQPSHIMRFMNNLGESGIREDDRYIMKDKYLSHFKANRKDLSKIGLEGRTISDILKGMATDKKTACKIAETVQIDLSTLFVPTNSKDKLSSQTLMHHYRLLNTILNAAVQWNFLLNNPAMRTKPPRVAQRETLSLDDEETDQMLSLLKSAPLKYQAAVHIAVFGGLRLGEIIALKWSDIDFQTGKLRVTKTRQYVTGIGNIEKSPKNDSSKRELTLSKRALLKLSELCKEQKSQRFALGSQWVDENNIFTRWNGTAMSPGTVSHWFTDWISKTGLPKITFHGLRHSNASILIAEGIDIVTVSKRLGHSRISTTTDIYTHAINKNDGKAAMVLDNVFPAVTRLAAQ